VDGQSIAKHTYTERERQRERQRDYLPLVYSYTLAGQKRNSGAALMGRLSHTDNTQHIDRETERQRDRETHTHLPSVYS
jgi:hypothetical protein